jgi:hypothetical protein
MLEHEIYRAIARYQLHILANNGVYVITFRKIVDRFRRFVISLKSIFRNLYEHILYFKEASPATHLTKSTIAVTAETTTFTHGTTTSAFAVAEVEAISSTYATTSTTTPTTPTTSTTTITNNNNNNKTYFIKLSGISQGDPMEGFPQYSGGVEKND